MDEALFGGIRYILCDTAAFGQKQEWKGDEKHVDFWERSCAERAVSSTFLIQVCPYAWCFHRANQETHGSCVELVKRVVKQEMGDETEGRH